MNSMNKRSISRPFAVTALSAALLMTSASGTFAAETKHESAKAADQTQVTDREVISHYAGWEDPEMARVAVHGGRALLRRLDKDQINIAHNALNQDPPQLETAQSAIESSMDSLVHATVSMHLFPNDTTGSKTSDNSTIAADQAG